MVRNWVESRRRGREDPLNRLTAVAPLGGEVAAAVSAHAPHPHSNSSAHSPAHSLPHPTAHPPPAVRPSSASPPGLSPSSGLRPEMTRASALVSVIRGVGSPLQSAVSEVAAGLRERGDAVSPAEEARAFGQLVQQVVSMSRITSSTLDVGVEAIASWSGEPLRWAVLEAVSEIVGAHYRAVGVLQPSGVVGQMVAAVTQIAVDGARREDLMPGLGNATQARPGLAMLRAVPPVVHAVARYAFGRNPLVLVTEIAWELQYKAVESTRRLLAGGGATLEEWHAVYGAFVVAAGQQYAEAHFGEADHTSRLSADEREALRRQHGHELPMDSVWDAFDRKLETLATFSGYMAMPPSSPAVAKSATSAGVLPACPVKVVS